VITEHWWIILKTKKQRNRSIEDKKQQMDQIIQVGKELFTNNTRFSMRELARLTGMGEHSASSLYRYIPNKRELWFAIVNQDFDDFDEGILDLIKEHQGTTVELIHAIGTYFIDFSLSDLQRFERMYMNRAPLSDKPPGEFETKSNITQKFSFTKVVAEALAEQGLDEDPSLLALTLWSSVLGASVLSYLGEVGSTNEPPLLNKELMKKFRIFINEKLRVLYAKKE